MRPASAVLVTSALLFLATASLASATNHATFNSHHTVGGPIQPGKTFEHRFKAAGTYYYHSSTGEHGAEAVGFRGSVIVCEAQGEKSTQAVEIESGGFHPEVVKIRPKTSVVWTNKDTQPHTVTEDADSPGPSELTCPTDQDDKKGILPGSGFMGVILSASVIVFSLRRKS